MKNDLKKKDNSVSAKTGEMEEIPNKSAKEVVESVQTEDLKKELSQVLQEMRKNVEEGRLCKVCYHDELH